jgi:hypothetical protein
LALCGDLIDRSVCMYHVVVSIYRFILVSLSLSFSLSHTLSAWNIHIIHWERSALYISYRSLALRERFHLYEGASLTLQFCICILESSKQARIIAHQIQSPLIYVWNWIFLYNEALKAAFFFFTLRCFSSKIKYTPINLLPFVDFDSMQPDCGYLIQCRTRRKCSTWTTLLMYWTSSHVKTQVSIELCYFHVPFRS